ncbi:MAG TPA: zinc-ribbon domain-containing protein [Acetobacteraceae bacterium]|nr:zinc-ribbon domain-containing protein [Acetobacteraceae bacterium]
MLPTHETSLGVLSARPQPKSPQSVVALRSGVEHDARHMRIGCSSCSATYDVPDSLVTPGRIVRCARCGNEWAPVEAVPEAPLDEQPDSRPEPPSPAAEAIPDAAMPAVQQSAMDRLIADPATSPSALRLRIAWAASVVALVALLGAAFTWRTQVVSVWPPSARAYALFGMHPAGQGTPR